MKMIFRIVLATLIFGALPALADTPSLAASPAMDTNANPEAAMTALFGDPVVARGKGFEIKRSQVDATTLNLKGLYTARGAAAPANVDGQALLLLINQNLVLSKATAADKVKAKEKFQASLQQLKTSQQLTDDQVNQLLEKQLILRGQTRAQWEQQNIDQAAIPIVLKRELNVSVSDAEAEEYYTNHPADFEMAETVQLSDILLLTVNPNTGTPVSLEQQQAKRKKIDDLLKRARNGENFTNLAVQYSEDPVAKNNGGKTPPLSRDQMSPELAAAAFSLTNNQISDVIEMNFGYYIIKLLDKVPAKKLALTDKTPASDLTVLDRIKEYLAQRKIDRQAPAYLKQMAQAYNVEILDPKLKSLELSVEAAQAADTNAPAVAPGK